MKNTFKNTIFRNSIILSSLLIGTVSLCAEEEQKVSELADVLILEEKEAPFVYNKISKSKADLEKAQVSDIRDLTKYDPGISVNEQGQGGSAGYSMRGVDRNRVAIQVDGISQGQVFSPGTNYNGLGDFGGTINEIEYENIKEVKILKGASSVEGGNGAMGGAVLFETKEADDIIKDGQNYGIDFKTGYSSKNERTLNSLGVAGRKGKFDALLQFTHRGGHELKSHKDTKSQKLKYRYSPEPGRAGFDALSEPKINTYETVYDAKNVWGPTREVANPMDYESKSWLFRTGYAINPSHYVGLIFEKTNQEYNVWDLTKPAFNTSSKVNDPKWESVVGKSAYQWLRSYYQDNIHEKKRYGVEYKYENPKSDGWIDSSKVSFDSQIVEMTNIYLSRACSKTVATRNCWPSDFDGQAATNHTTGTKEKQNTLRLKLNKDFPLWNTQHEFSLFAGLGKTTFNHKVITGGKLVNYIGHYDRKLGKYVAIRKGGEGFKENSLKPVDGKHYYLGIKDDITFNEYFVMPLGLRNDSYKFESDNRFSRDPSYNNTSWNAGLVFTPNNNIELAYVASNGFRVPSFEQMYGIEVLYPGALSKNFDPKKTKDLEIKPEEAFNQELGLTLNNNLGYIKLSAFRTDYKNLIGITSISGIGGHHIYDNIQKASLYGYDLQLFSDLNELTSFFPSGLTSTFAYSIVKPKNANEIDAKGDRDVNTNYILDTLQPERFVFGVDYENISGKWGLGTKVIHSKPKKEEEAKRFSTHPVTGEKVQTTEIFQKLSESWTTVDVYGWIELKKYVTLRGGINNLFDKKYSTWESLRQLGVKGISTTGNVNVEGEGINRLSAPGRNFTVTMEIKF